MEQTAKTGPGRADVWNIVETERPGPRDTHMETIFSQANGYLGLRGNFCEAGAARSGTVGTYINGFYESGPICYGEPAFGYPRQTQTMLNVTNGQILKIFLDGEPFDPDAGELQSYRRSLSMKTGLLCRQMVWKSPAGRRAEICIERLVSFENRHLAAYRCRVTPLNFDGRVTFRSGLCGDVSNRAAGDDPRVGALPGAALKVEEVSAAEDFSFIRSRTARSGLGLCCATSGRVVSGPFTARASAAGRSAAVEYETRAERGKAAVLEKFLVYYDTRDRGPEKLAPDARTALGRALELGFGHFERAQADYLGGYWARCGVEIDGDDRLQQGIRYNMFQLLQSAGADGRTSVSSKGLSGEGYAGHYFWDTEMYVTPFFTFTKPEIARRLLEYRYRTLPAARARAREMSQPAGALYPWRTIAGGECSAYFPAGTAQAHIDGDIAHAVRLYVQATGDERFLCEGGAEILVETARLWAGLGFFNPRRGGKFCINEVTGPDEYSALVNNNCYTNMIAAENLRSACEACRLLSGRYPEDFDALKRKTGLSDDEPALWEKAAERMYIPYDEQLGIHLQDDGFLDREPWDFEHTPPENYPLLLHYHPLVIYRHRVCKQADMVLALFLFPDAFTPEQKKRDYEFYEPYTTHDSSLSTSIFCIEACALGELEKAYRYFMRTARMDLDDCNGNTGDGIHTANMAGAWMGIACGFGGMKLSGGKLCFDPALPRQWKRLRFRVGWRGSRVEVAADGGGVRYTLVSGGPLSFFHRGRAVKLEKAGDTAEFPPRPAGLPADGKAKGSDTK